MRVSDKSLHWKSGAHAAGYVCALLRVVDLSSCKRGPECTISGGAVTVGGKEDLDLEIPPPLSRCASRARANGGQLAAERARSNGSFPQLPQERIGGWRRKSWNRSSLVAGRADRHDEGSGDYPDGDEARDLQNSRSRDPPERAPRGADDRGALHRLPSPGSALQDSVAQFAARRPERRPEPRRRPGRSGAHPWSSIGRRSICVYLAVGLRFVLARGARRGCVERAPDG